MQIRLQVRCLEDINKLMADSIRINSILGKIERKTTTPKPATDEEEGEEEGKAEGEGQQEDGPSEEDGSTNLTMEAREA